MSIKMRGILAGIVVVFGSLGVAMGQEGFEPPKPTPEHKALAEELGVWEAEMFVYIPGTDKPIPAGKGVETNTMLPGGLWLLSEFKGDARSGAFEGRGQTGFDTKKSKFVGSWVDSMTTKLLVLEGTYDAKTKTTTMLGEGDDPHSGSAATIKTTTHLPDADNRVFSMFIKPKGGQESDFVKTFEIR